MDAKTNPYIRQTEAGSEITPAGTVYLQEIVTNPTGNTYSFYDRYNPKVVAAAMARLSRFGGDMRELILKEFAAQDGQEEMILRRILTQFGDDSVQQLDFLPLVVENASNLMMKHLERGRLAAYLEQSTRYIYYDVKRHGQYRYYTPPYLPAKLAAEYKKAMDQIFDNYSEVVRRLTDHYHQLDTTPEAQRGAPWRIALRGKACDVGRGLLPLATTSTVGIVGSAQAVDSLIMHLMAQDLPEAQAAGQQILEEVRKQHDVFFERTDLPNRGSAISTYKRQTRQRFAALAGRLSAGEADRAADIPVRLLGYTPKNELDLLPHMLFPHTQLSLGELTDALKTWPRKDKLAAFDLYMGERLNRRHKPGRALEVAHYDFELVSDYGCFKDLQRHRIVDGLEWQPLGIHLGYDMPQAIIEAGLEDLYRQTVAIADELYQKIKKAGFAEEAQYATLHTHKLRWKLTFNAREAFHLIELRTQPAGHFSYRKLAGQMYDEIARVHPRLAAHMIFVNRNDDDPSMSRLEQAEAAQAKLKLLGLEGLIE
ncbi:MAG TPA: FAD-dependent thymidylate synthase [Candidatus Acidoferrum sp.]|nr:FAD-dependent thymidylate synthase [Candidatus Acidoferrum sp.]